MSAKGHELSGSREGFGLIEVVVAMLMASMALVALAGVAVSTMHLQRNTESRMEYVALGEAKLDQLRAFAALRHADTVQLAVGGSLTSDVTNHAQTMTSARGRQYRIRWLVAAGINNTRDVTVRIAPVNRGTQEVAYLDLFARLAME